MNSKYNESVLKPQILKLYNKGMSQCSICEILNINRGIVVRWYKKWGIKSKKILGIYRKSYKTGKINCGKYRKVYSSDHPRKAGCYVYEHIIVVEKALGRLLSKKQEIHHIDNNGFNNSNNNLVICENRNYHRLLHVRTKALKKSGNANNRKCKHCEKWDVLENLIEQERNKTNFAHKQCRTEYCKKYWLLYKSKK